MVVFTLPCHVSPGRNLSGGAGKRIQDESFVLYSGLLSWLCNLFWVKGSSSPAHRPPPLSSSPSLFLRKKWRECKSYWLSGMWVRVHFGLNVFCNNKFPKFLKLQIFFSSTFWNKAYTFPTRTHTLQSCTLAPRVWLRSHNKQDSQQKPLNEAHLYSVTRYRISLTQIFHLAGVQVLKLNEFAFVSH